MMVSNHAVVIYLSLTLFKFTFVFRVINILFFSMSPTAAEYAERHEIPPAEVQSPIDRATRPQIVGPDAPEPPFPIALIGPVQKGFGRGGKDLGCPTGASDFPFQFRVI